MSDTHARALERRWKASGSPEDERAWLQALGRAGQRLDWPQFSRLHELDADAAGAHLAFRAQRGDLPEASLSLVAKCGYGAGIALTQQRPANSLLEFREFDRESVMRILAAGVRAVLHQWPYPEEVRMLEHFERWLVGGPVLNPEVLEADGLDWTFSAARVHTEDKAKVMAVEAAFHLQIVSVFTADPAVTWDEVWWPPVETGMQLAGWSPQTTPTLQREVVPWSLGLFDPLRCRFDMPAGDFNHPHVR